MDACKLHSPITHFATALVAPSLKPNTKQIFNPGTTFMLIFYPTDLYVHVEERFTSQALSLQLSSNSWQTLPVPTFPDISGFFHPLKTFCLLLQAFLKQLLVQRNTEPFLYILFLLTWAIDLV